MIRNYLLVLMQLSTFLFAHVEGKEAQKFGIVVNCVNMKATTTVMTGSKMTLQDDIHSGPGDILQRKILTVIAPPLKHTNCQLATLFLLALCPFLLEDQQKKVNVISDFRLSLLTLRKTSIR